MCEYRSASTPVHTHVQPWVGREGTVVVGCLCRTLDPKVSPHSRSKMGPLPPLNKTLLHKIPINSRKGPNCHFPYTHL